MSEFEASASQILTWMTWYLVHQVTLTQLDAAYQYYFNKYQNHQTNTPDKTPPRGPNSYFVFLTALRSNGKAPSKIGWPSIAGTIWGQLSAAERRPMDEMAAKIKKLHVDFFPDYVYKPNRKSVPHLEANEAVGRRDSVGPQRQVKSRHSRRKTQDPYRSPEPGETIHLGECQVSSFVVDNYMPQGHSRLPNPVASHSPPPAPGGSRFQGSYDDAGSPSAFASSAAPAPVIAPTSATRTSFPHTHTSPRPSVTVAVAPASPNPPLYAAPEARAAHRGGSIARELSTRTYRASSAPASLPTTSYIAPPAPAPQPESPRRDVYDDRRSYSPYGSPSATWYNAPIVQQPNPSPPNVPFSLPPSSTLYPGQLPPFSPLPSTSSHPPATSQSDARTSQQNLDPDRFFGSYINEDAFAPSVYDYGDAPMHYHPEYPAAGPQAETWPMPTAETSQGSGFDPFSWMMSPSQGASAWSQEAYDLVTGVLPWRT